MSKKEAIHELLSRKSPHIQEIRNTENDHADKKKATFDLPPHLHMELKVFAARQNKKMVEVVEEALIKYLDAQ